jgi:hypothetical protein
VAVQALLDIHRYHDFGRKAALHHQREQRADDFESYLVRKVGPRPADRTSAVLRPTAYCTIDQWLRAAVITQLYPVDQGLVIAADPIQFSAIVKDLERDPSLVHQIHWRKWEELAAAYDREGFEIVLKPRSNDGGRDVIATRADIGTIRIYDQVKTLSSNRLVTATDVRAKPGVLCADPNVSKAFVTTTSDFTPGVYVDPRLHQSMPYRFSCDQNPLYWLG